jgi:hypothetical protein
MQEELEAATMSTERLFLPRYSFAEADHIAGLPAGTSKR